MEFVVFTFEKLSGGGGGVVVVVVACLIIVSVQVQVRQGPQNIVHSWIVLLVVMRGGLFYCNVNPGPSL